jgi:sugar phosphate isomerase/epimerase
MSVPPRIAFSTLAFPDATLAAAVGAGRRWGYSGIELRLIDGELIDPAMPAAGRAQVRRTLAALRDSGFGGFMSLEPHLARAGRYGGFSGPEGFTLAARSLKSILNDAGIPWR